MKWRHTMQTRNRYLKSVRDKRTRRLLYQKWYSMMISCYDKDYFNYRWYGMKGIKVAAKWQDFKAFYKWAIDNGYVADAGIIIARKDLDENFGPSNCYLSTYAAQNKRRTNNIYVFGLTLREYCERNNISYAAMLYRTTKRGMSVIGALIDVRENYKEKPALRGNTNRIKNKAKTTKGVK